jgi:hypothetical protein
VRYSDKLRKNAKKTQRQRMLDAAKKIIKAGVSREDYINAYNRRNNPWWREHNGELTVEHMAANTKNHVMRVLEVIEQIESFKIVAAAPVHSIPSGATKYGYNPPKYSEFAYDSPLAKEQMAANMKLLDENPELAALVAAVE